MTIDQNKHAFVGGGFIVVMRRPNRQIKSKSNSHPVEHGSMESAAAEAKRLAAKDGNTFAVFQQVLEVYPNE